MKDAKIVNHFGQTGFKNNSGSVSLNHNLTLKQRKAREKSKRAKIARRINRKEK